MDRTSDQRINSVRPVAHAVSRNDDLTRRLSVSHENLVLTVPKAHFTACLRCYLISPVYLLIRPAENEYVRLRGMPGYRDFQESDWELVEDRDRCGLNGVTLVSRVDRRVGELMYKLLDNQILIERPHHTSTTPYLYVPVAFPNSELFSGF